MDGVEGTIMEVIVWTSIWKLFPTVLIGAVVFLFVVLFGLVGWAWFITRRAEIQWMLIAGGLIGVVCGLVLHRVLGFAALGFQP